MSAYHVRRKERAIEDTAELRAVLKRGRFAVIAMCRGDEPYVVTLNHGFDEDRGCLYYHAALEGQKLDFLRGNPQVCATVIEDRGYVVGDCSHKYRSVVVRGTLAIVEEDGEKAHAMEALIRHQEPDPKPVLDRFLADPKWMAGVVMLRLDIREMTGKANL